MDRLAGERGFCGAGAVARVAAISLHMGEEPPISGTRGSGTVFFSHCNMACRFCQNYPISQMGHGRDMDAGTANIQWVDQSEDPGTWYYLVNAFSSVCNAEGPR